LLRLLSRPSRSMTKTSTRLKSWPSNFSTTRKLVGANPPNVRTWSGA
jgi:hypothetical protein